MPARLVRSRLNRRATVAALVITARVAAVSRLVMLTRLESLPELKRRAADGLDATASNADAAA